MTNREHCTTCQRGKQHFDGCSHTDCPKRRQHTARITGTPDFTPAMGIDGSASNHGLRRMPTTTGDD